MALGDESGAWFLCNAGPDLGVQLRDTEALWPRPGDVDSPVQAVLLTDAELDHTVGLLALRQAHRLRVYGTAPVRDLLTESGLLPILSCYTSLDWCEVEVGEEFVLGYQDGRPSSLGCRAFAVGTGRLPRYARTTGSSAEAVVGYVVQDARTGGRAAIAPSIAADDESIGEELGTTALALVDGTFWDDDELRRTGRSNAAAQSLGHVSVSSGKLGTRAASGGAKVVYTHLNNTNRMILADSSERESILEQGFMVADDGAEFVL